VGSVKKAIIWRMSATSQIMKPMSIIYKLGLETQLRRMITRERKEGEAVLSPA
jgi:hypothetical protein